MTFRDDHDATLARAEALARELDDAKRKLEASEAEREADQDERARLRAEVERLRALVPEPARAPPPKRAPMEPGTLVILVLVVITAALVGIQCAREYADEQSRESSP